MAEIVRYVDTDIAVGGDGTSWAAAYKKLSAWNAAQAKNLTANTEHHTVYVRGIADDTTGVNMSGWTNPTSSYHVHIICSDPHKGVRAPTKYWLKASVAYSAALTNIPAYSEIDGLQVTNTSSLGTVGIFVPGDNTIIRRCLAVDCAGTAHGIFLYTAGSKAINCGAFNNGGNGIAFHHNSAAYNCVSANNDGNGFYIDSAYKTGTAKNCYAGGNGGSDYAKVTDSVFNLTNCYSEDGSLSTSTAAFSTSSGARFTNVTAGSEDLHLNVSSALIDAGVDASADIDPDEDVNGQARPSGAAWDVGYDEYVAAVTVKPHWYYEQMRKAG